MLSGFIRLHIGFIRLHIRFGSFTACTVLKTVRRCDLGAQSMR